MIRVLIVDNNVELCETLTEYLGTLPDMEVVGSAYDGEEGLRMIAEHEPDVVLLDITMPRLDGMAVLERLPNQTIILGVLNLGEMVVERPAVVAERIRAALRHVPPERLLVAPDCGMKYLPREVAVGKLRAMVEGARLVRRELGAE